VPANRNLANREKIIASTKKKAEAMHPRALHEHHSLERGGKTVRRSKRGPTRPGYYIEPGGNTMLLTVKCLECAAGEGRWETAAGSHAKLGDWVFFAGIVPGLLPLPDVQGSRGGGLGRGRQNDEEEGQALEQHDTGGFGLNSRSPLEKPSVHSLMGTSEGRDGLDERAMPPGISEYGENEIRVRD